MSAPGIRDVAGVVLAAGAGRRMGGPKALVELGGTPLVVMATRALVEGGCAPVGVVTGSAGDRVAGVLVSDAVGRGATIVPNDRWEEGQATSVAVGLSWAAARGVGGVLLHLVDLPGVGPAAVARLLRAREEAHPGVQAWVATYGGHPRNPVLLAADAFEDVMAGLAGDRGARGWLDTHPEVVQHVACDDVAVPDDLDTPDDLDLSLIHI